MPFSPKQVIFEAAIEWRVAQLKPSFVDEYCIMLAWNKPTDGVVKLDVDGVLELQQFWSNWEIGAFKFSLPMLEAESGG